MKTPSHSPLIPTAEVKRQTALSVTSLWRKSKDGSFPSPVYLGNKKLWYQHQIDKWLEDNLSTAPSHNNLEVAK